MSWAMELSPAGFDAMFADLAWMDRKTGRAYLHLVGYLRRFGSVPSGERALASVLGVTVRFLRDVAWPLLEDRLVLSEDKRRYSDPDITAANPRRAAGAPTVAEKSAQQQRAALKRWDEERRLKALADASETHAQTHTNRMRDASETHAQTHAGDASTASVDASDASPRAYASPPPLKEDSLFQPVEKKESLGGEGTARAHARADAPTHADGMRTHAQNPMNSMTDAFKNHAPHAKNHAQTHAVPHARGGRPNPPGTRPITADWQPSPSCRADAQLLGVTVDGEITKFVAWNLDKGEPSADWDARFIVWCHRQVEWARRNPQRQAPIVIPGGAAVAAPVVLSEAEKAREKALETLKARMTPVYHWWVRNQQEAEQEGSPLMPIPPFSGPFLAHCEAGRSRAAYRWLEVLEAFRAADERCTDLPEFEAYVADPAAYEAAMLACEERFTAPDADARASA